MMKDLNEQIEALNNAFHNIWFAVMFERSDYKTEEVRKLSFIEMHLIGLAYKHPDMLIKELRQYLTPPPRPHPTAPDDIQRGATAQTRVMI